MRTPETLDHVHGGCGITSFLSYFMSAVLTVGGHFLDFLDTHAAAFGVLLGFATFCVNVYFQRKNHHVLAEKNG